MNQRSEIQPVPVATQTSLTQGLPRWEQLPAEHRHALIIALAEMVVKRLPDQNSAKDVDDG
jgi:hypothetical protein